MSSNSDTTGETRTEVLDPRGTVSSSRNPIAERLESLDGATIGFLDNSKENADVLLDEVETVLVDEYGVEETVYMRKDKSPIPADSLADQLHHQCDGVVNAYGDCGSCTSWCVYDSIDLEKQGTPTATVNTDEFARLGQSEARSLGMPALPITTVPHPMGGIPEDDVREHARAAVPTIVELLTGDREALEAEYENKYLEADEELSDSDLYCPI